MMKVLPAPKISMRSSQARGRLRRARDRAVRAVREFEVMKTESSSTDCVSRTRPLGIDALDARACQKVHESTKWQTSPIILRLPRVRLASSACAGRGPR